MRFTRLTAVLDVTFDRSIMNGVSLVATSAMPDDSLSFDSAPDVQA